MSLEKLIYMANQIGRFFTSQPGAAHEGIADHLMKFWEPRMRRAIKAHVAAGGAGLDPEVRRAVEMMPQPGGAAATDQHADADEVARPPHEGGV